MVFAEHGQYAFTFHGGPFDDVTLKEIRDDLVLIKQELAEPEQWKKALDHAGALFGLTVNPLRTANNQNDLQKQVLDVAASHVEACRTLDADLIRQLDALGLTSNCNRLNNARLAVQLLDTLQDKEGPELVDALADVKPVTSLPALAKSIASANRVSNAIADNNWALLEKVWSGDDPEGAKIKRSVAEALAADELVTALAAALKQAQAVATAIITNPQDREPPKPDQDPERDPEPIPKGKKVLKQDSRQGLSAREARRILSEIQSGLSDGVTVDIEYKIVGEESA
jgi:hypothetical protein